MTDLQFHKRMMSLSFKLCIITNKGGYKSDAYNAILDEIREMGVIFNRKRRRRRWFTRFAGFSAILFVLYLVYCLVSEGFCL